MQVIYRTLCLPDFEIHMDSAYFAEGEIFTIANVSLHIYPLDFTS